MVAEQPEIARLRSRLVGRRRHLIGIAQAVLDAGVQELGQFVLVEAQEAEVIVARLKFGQLNRKQVVIPVRQFGGLVVSDAVGLDLLGRQVGGDVDWDLLEAELLRGL
jgi:hypothetical protein